MSGNPIRTAHEYAAAIMQRGRIFMEPLGFEPDWNDRPRKEKYYPGVTSLPLPAGTYPAGARLEDGMHPRRGDAVNGFDLDSLSGMLLDSYALTGRRLAVQANTDLSGLPFYTQGNWSRGTASGGGLYPVSTYWVSGPQGPMVPGVYHYSTKHHAMQRLLTGDVSGRVAAALGGADTGTDQYLVLGIKYWQNAFKYNSFCYHAVSMDLGTIVQSWTLWARSRGLELRPALWFDEPALANLLGLTDGDEGLFAVIPLAWAGVGPHSSGEVSSTSEHLPRVRHRDSERSATVIEFDVVRQMHDRARAEAATRPAPGALASAATLPVRRGTTVALPAPTVLTMGARQALRTRRSSFGRFDASTPLDGADFAAALAAAAATRIDCDVSDPAIGLAKIYAFVNHVDGIEPGAYEYDPALHTLQLVTPGPPGDFLQRNYFLANYNLEQAAAVLVPTVRTTAVLDAVGERGYRLVNATVGAISQSVYTAAAALDIGCGVALGFDNISFIEELDLLGTDEAPLLIMMIGNERPQPADFRYEIA